MAKLTKSYKEHLYERLQNPAQAAGYLNAALEEEDIDVFLLALRDVADVRGIARVARAAGLNRENVYRMLSDQGNPTLSSMVALLRVLDIQLQVQPSIERKKEHSVTPLAVVEASLQEAKTSSQGATPATPARLAGDDYGDEYEEYVNKGVTESAAA